MNLQELDSFKLSDAVTFHDELNPELWRNNHLRPEVKDQLLIIAEDFLSELGISDVEVQDITVSGSNAAYSYTPHSDLDLHLLVDLSRFDDDIYKEFFHAKKSLYNEAHDIKIHGVPVEVYVQDSREPVVSLGEYSVMQDKWLRLPTKRRANFDQSSTKSKYETLLQLIEIALKSKDLKKVQKITNKIKQYRQAGLDKGGEFGPENLAYKALRSQGYITKLYDLRDKLHSEVLTIENMYQDPVKIQEARSAYKEIEFICANPEFPDATDPELQQQLFSELKKIPGVIPLFQDQSHYSEGQRSLTAIYKNPNIKPFILKLAKSLGVGVDLIQPVSDDYVDRAIRGELEGQINESSGYIPSEKEKNDPRFKTALTVDVKPDSIKKNAKSFYWKTSRAGIPPTLNPNGKF